jgi:hypothetical protein
VLVGAAFWTGCQEATEPADLILTNGKIVTVDEALPEAQALAVRGDTIVAVGSNADVEAHRGSSTQVIDLEGRLAIPGFIEGHGHFMGLGLSKMQLDLMEVKNWDEVVAMVAEAVKTTEPGKWIGGRGWHQEKWDQTPSPNVEGFPTHESLSAVSPENPVVLRHASGHAAFANAKAMALAGITRNTPDPEGGEILKDRAGNPIGLFRETAQRLLNVPPDTSEATLRKQVELASDEALANGVTSFQDAGSSLETVDLLKKLADEGSLRLRLWVMLRDSNERLAEALARYRLIDHGNKFLTVRAIKHSIDGALGPRGAWLLEPYSDLPESTGLNTTKAEVITETARLAIEQGYQLCVHAIGDRGNREALDIFEKTFAAHPDKKDLRWRIEHAQHLHPDDVPRFGRLGVIASMQGIHCTSDAPYVVPRLGEDRARQGAYVWRSLKEAGAVVTNGTDVPVENISPIASYYATVTRKLRDGRAFFPEQKLDRLEALKSYTIDTAFAAFEEQTKGSLAVGKLADITVLSRDILTVPDDEIAATEVLYTIVGGKVAYPKKGGPPTD